MDMENSCMCSRECSDRLQRPTNTCRFSFPGAESKSNAGLPQGVTSERDENGRWREDIHAMDTERSVTTGQNPDTQTNLQQQVHDIPTSPRAGNNHLHEDMHNINRQDEEPETTVAIATDRQMKKGALLCLSATKIMALIILGIVIAGVFSVPIALFVLKTNHSSDSTLLDSTETECNTYTGEVCQSVLLARQSCIPGRENSTAVSVSLSPSQHTTVEQQFAQLLMSVTPSPSCNTELQSFLCVEAFAGLCDGNGAVQRTTRQECERITTTVCAAEFQIILPKLEADGFALSCDTFPNSSSICTNMANEGGDAHEILIPFHQGSNGTGVVLDRNCSEGFFMDDLGLCKPECGEWRPLSNSQVEVLTIVTLTSGALGATLCLVVVILSFIHYRTMFSFPGIFIFYQMLSSMVYVIVYLIDYVDFKALFCGSTDLLESLMPGNETPMCIISASAWIYISHQVELWWIFHLSMVFCAVFWPLKYHYWKQLGYFKYIHFVMVLAALVLPIIPVIICYSVDGYVLYFLIRPDCVARNTQAAFYSHVLPLLAAVAIGLYLLILILWKFFSEEWIGSKRLGFTKRQVEIKIILLLCCYVIIWADVIGATVAILIEAEDYRNTLTEYFTCEAAGVEGCPRGAFEKFDVVSKIIAYALVGLYPAIFLVYFVSVKNTCGKSRTAINSTGTSASVLSRNIS